MNKVMSNQTPDRKFSQKASHVGGKVTQVGRDYKQTTRGKSNEAVMKCQIPSNHCTAMVSALG
ncbi:MAG TPA: hypothetical protein V6C91_07090 [Coleofasciculaceae cyanobacterium]